MQRRWEWRSRRTGVTRVRKRVEVLNGHWEPLEFFTQESEPSGTKLVDARNGFNELSCLEILWTVRHRCPAGARFAFNFYRHWVQLLLCQPGEPQLTILSREGSHPG